MARKKGGLAAIMSGQPMVVVKKRTVFWRLKLLTRQGGLHVGLICVCMIYVYTGALFFKYLEGPEEISANMFDCLFYTRTNYTPLWTTDSALLFTATTIIPVGYGYIAPLTPLGRILLCVYAGFGIPLTLVMMSDVGKFLADLFVKLFNENITIFMIVLIFLLVAYSIIGGIAIAKAVGIPMIEGIYFSTITIFTIGYGDVSPSIPVYIVIGFIVFGVALVTISIDVVAANIIHNIHYMGRQVGKAKIIADKMIMMAQKININRGLGLGMAQLGAFAKMGMMINVNSIGIQQAEPVQDETKLSPDSLPSPNDASTTSATSGFLTGSGTQRKSTAFEPDIDFDMIDYKTDGLSHYQYGYDNQSDNSVFM